jgi:CheY-like chemotaxis protein
MLNLASLRDEIEDLNQRALIDRISGYLRKGIKLVGRVLKVSNGKSTPLNWEMVNLNQVIKDVRDLVGDIIPTSVEQRFELTNPGCPVWGDSDQLFLVFMNLIVNARDAMPSGGKLNVCVEDVCRENARWVCVKVSDSGIGIPEDKLPRIFEEFFTTKPNGTGFGLATARAIVNEHGGSIHVDSREEFGTTFEVRLPAYCVDFIPDTVEPTTGQSPLVLLVEDEEALCQVFKRMLENAKYNVVTAQDGLEGLKIFSSRTREINVVITDIRMPKMSGINLIEAIRKIDPVCKIVVTTGDGLPEYREQLDRLDVPVQGFLRKPFTQSDLVNTVQNVVSMQ